MKHWTCIKPYIALIFALLAWAGSSSINHRFQAPEVQKNPAIFILSEQSVKHISMGYRHLMATLLWFNTSAYYGSHTQNTDYHYLGHLLHTMNTLNPKFEPPYYMAASVFPWGMNSSTLSQTFLQNAMITFPHDWRWAYYLGFQTYWFDHQYELAAHYFELAASKPHAPPMMASLALRMHSHIGNIDVGLKFLEGLLKRKNSADVQAKLQHQYLALRTEQQLRRIEAWLKTLPKRTHDMHDIHKLRALHYPIPTTLADGGHIRVLDDGSLRSSKSDKRFQLFIPKKRQHEVHHATD